MKWLLENLGIVVVITLAAISFLRTAIRGAQDSPRDAARRPAGKMGDDPEQAERTRRVQEEIRRKIAERRGELPVQGGLRRTIEERAETARDRIPPLVRPQHVPPVDPFGGPMRKILRELEKVAEQPAVRAREDREAAEALERQAELDRQLRALEAARKAESQRAAEIAARTIQAQARSGAEASRRRELHDLLQNKRELRRAFLLREILDRPVGLR